jgi:hypothetical protein
MGDAVPPPWRPFDGAPFSMVEIVFADDKRSATMLIPAGFEVRDKKPFRDRYWESYLIHTEMMKLCAEVGAKVPRHVGVFDQGTLEPVALTAYHETWDANKRAFLDVMCLEFFLPRITSTATMFAFENDTLTLDQQWELARRTGARVTAAIPRTAHTHH